MATTIMDGQYDTMRHNPSDPLKYHAMDMSEPIRFYDWACGSVYIHDMRFANGHVPQGPNNVFDAVSAALPELLRKSDEVTARILMWPTGRDGTPHVFGGAFLIGRCAFFVGRRPRNAAGQHVSHKFLCAHVY